MKKRTRLARLARFARLATTTALALALGACGEGTPIAGIQPPTVTMTDPEADLPQNGLQIINSSAGIATPGIPVNAGVRDFPAGQFSIDLFQNSNS